MSVRGCVPSRTRSLGGVGPESLEQSHRLQGQALPSCSPALLSTLPLVSDVFPHGEQMAVVTSDITAPAHRCLKTGSENLLYTDLSLEEGAFPKRPAVPPSCLIDENGTRYTFWTNHGPGERACSCGSGKPSFPGCSALGISEHSWSWSARRNGGTAAGRAPCCLGTAGSRRPVKQAPMPLSIF